MLPKVHRIRKTAEYSRIYKKGEKYYSPFFVLFVNHKPPQPLVYTLPKFGIVASKKVGKAVQRNKAKRWIREVIKDLLPNLKQDFEAVIVANSSILKSDYHEIKQVTEKAFKKASLFSEIT